MYIRSDPKKQPRGAYSGILSPPAYGGVGERRDDNGHPKPCKVGDTSLAHSTDWLLTGARAFPGGRGRGWLMHTSRYELLKCSWLRFSSPELIDDRVYHVAENKPEPEIGTSRRKAFSFSLISMRFYHRWRSAITKPAILCPTGRAVCFVARRAKSVALQSSLTALRVTPSPSSISFSTSAW